IGDSCWLATDVFVSPGIIIGSNCVVGARSSVFKNLPSNSICVGNPAVKIRDK
ncbi:TPA: colanic acid biosynthesis acetyltransferase WcaF, partial [Klebsiella pneumoniae]|nr:colanic acid biosynthesis acetyltransferase WcaF [Klebsiella pneumoniae]